MVNKKYMLIPEMIPTTSWYSNIRTSVPKEEWDKIRKGIYKKANYKCEICKDTTKILHCHEIWKFNTKTKTQKLENLKALCPYCHMIIHAGFSMGTEEGKKQYDTKELIKHFCKINKCEEIDFKKCEKKAYILWEKRNKIKWEINKENSIQKAKELAKIK